MNVKKQAKNKRRAPKLNPKLDKGNLQRRIAEGKSNIGAKRVTLLPGFLINGFTSGTAKKTKGQVQNAKDHLLTENLQAFLEQKSNLRRSQRILKKQNEGENTTTISKSQHDDLPISNSPLNAATNTKTTKSPTFKSALKKNSKSIFKEISDKYCRVQIQNQVELQENNHGLNNNIIEFEKLPKYKKQSNELASRNEPFTLRYNHFTEEFAKHIQVTLKKSVIKECQENIQKEIHIANLLLQGKVKRHESILDGGEHSDSEDKALENLQLVSPRNWRYSTPKNQKINVPEVVACPIQPAVVYSNNNCQNLYELKSKYNANFLNIDNATNIPVDNRFFKKVAAVKKTPCPVRVSRQADDNRYYWNDLNSQLGCNLEGQLHCQQPLFSNAKMPNYPAYENYFENHMPQNNIVGDPECDFTLIAQGNHFKVQESQAAYKRSTDGEEELIMKRRGFNVDPSRFEKPKMYFDFGSQGRNMFDFEVVM